MEKLVLVRPTEELREAALDYKEEHLRQGEMVLHGSALFDSMEFEPWLKLTQENALGQTVRPDCCLLYTSPLRWPIPSGKKWRSAPFPIAGWRLG